MLLLDFIYTYFVTLQNISKSNGLDFEMIKKQIKSRRVNQFNVFIRIKNENQSKTTHPHFLYAIFNDYFSNRTIDKDFATKLTDHA